MIKPRVIPALLLRGQGLVKTVKFKEPKYLGDPINIVRIFNDKEVDELVLLDITATPENCGPRFSGVAVISNRTSSSTSLSLKIRTMLIGSPRYFGS